MAQSILNEKFELTILSNLIPKTLCEKEEEDWALVIWQSKAVRKEEIPDSRA